MNIDHFTFGAVTPILSYALSVLGSLLGLVATARARLMNDSKRRGRWLLLGAWAIGGTGIWVMHFMAMLGFTVAGVSIRYDLLTTLASMATAIVVVAIGMFIVGYGKPNLIKIIFAGVITGLGVAGMHYTGMAAMRMPAMIHYDRTLVIASIVIAVVAATVALWFTVTLRRPILIVIAALIMGIAVNGMHFTGMFAMSVTPKPDAPVTGFMPILFVAPIALFVIGVFIVLLTALINRDDSSTRGGGLASRLVPQLAPTSGAPAQPGSRIAGAFGPRPGRP